MNVRVSRPWIGLVVLGLLAGCQLIPQQPIEEPPPPAIQRPPAPPPEPTQVRLADAMDRLQYGDFDAAERMLDRLQQANPGSSTLALMLRQLREPPASLLPGPYRTIAVESGDTLSEIADEELGNPLLFVALARLNGLDVPRQLSVGMTLQVPVERPVRARTQEPASDEAAAAEVAVADVEDSETAPENAPESSRRSELETVAEYLLASGQPTDARELLLAAARNGNLSTRAEELLVELALDSARAEAAAGQYDAAAAGLAQVADALDPGPLRSRLEVRRTRIEVQARLERAGAFEERGLYYEAYTLAEQALLMDPDYGPAVELEASLRETLVTEYHDRALRAWRARDIDLAIRTWRELLDVVPDFEPARVYLDRAERLRSRLAEPD